ncbi:MULTISPECIES: hypothetical protein [unclassified Agarivorans]|uniref:hypothetical protein n=1 Tax=unclassified Agarivorans TaxID=2636026 RepID=UPI0026E29A89|nr:MULTISPECIES: hypothetical protein [unclassified Agarivorans]MDO6684198.1 hypothetical protein [Agarivorans sp. 3_MG-2023]MDO6714068.1 hypothetical protein [Agarivorans sp. 2_MG-2023]
MKTISVLFAAVYLAACSNQPIVSSAPTNIEQAGATDDDLLASIQQSSDSTKNSGLTAEQLYMWQNMSCGGGH